MTKQRQFRVYTDPPRPVSQMLSVRDDENSPTGLAALYKGRWYVVTARAGQMSLGKPIEQGDEDE